MNRRVPTDIRLGIAGTGQTGKASRCKQAAHSRFAMQLALLAAIVAAVLASACQNIYKYYGHDPDSVAAASGGRDMRIDLEVSYRLRGEDGRVALAIDAPKEHFLPWDLASHGLVNTDVVMASVLGVETFLSEGVPYRKFDVYVEKSLKGSLLPSDAISVFCQGGLVPLDDWAQANGVGEQDLPAFSQERDSQGRPMALYVQGGDALLFEGSLNSRVLLFMVPIVKEGHLPMGGYFASAALSWVRTDTWRWEREDGDEIYLSTPEVIEALW